MSVIKSLRNTSNMEFYKNAIYIRNDLTKWMIKDFGTKRNAKTVKQVLKDISPEDQEVFDGIYEKYGKNPNRAFQSEYPEWFVEFERNTICKVLQELVQNITQANSIHPSKDRLSDLELRRSYQNKAIGNCYTLYQELQYITSLFPTDLNRFVYLLDDIEREISLLKGWRQSDSKIFKQTVQKPSKVGIYAELYRKV